MTRNLSTHRFVSKINLSAGPPRRLCAPDDVLAHDMAKERPL